MGVIRFLLAVSVVIFHSQRPIFGLTLVDGWTAVKLFFITSGFYMALILNGKYSSYSRFILNRMLKLFPAYWFVLILCVLFDEEKIFNLSGIWGLYYFISNIFIVGSHYTSAIIERSGELMLLPFGEPLVLSELTWKYLYIGPVWSLSVEILFYFLAPFLVTNSFFFLKILFMIASSVVAYCLFAFNNSWGMPWSYNFFIPSMYLFALGALGWRAYYSDFFKKLSGKKLNSLLLVFLVSYCLLFQFLPPKIGLSFININIDPTTLGILVFSLALPFVFELSKNSKIDDFFGGLSYPIYISHFFVIYYFPYFRQWHPLVGTILLSVAIDFCVIKPIDRYRLRLVK